MIKRTPTDFQVEETLGKDLAALPVNEGPFALYRLSKEGLATPEAVGRIARELKVPANTFAYAGLKDKHASTIQHVTLKLENLPPPPEKASGAGWSLERLAFVSRPIASADIARNRFRITLRNLTPQDCFDMDRAARMLAIGDGKESGADKPKSSLALRIVNYFGDQRFGSARHGKGFIAQHLIRGDFETALKLAIATEARKDRMEQKVFKRTLLEHWGDWKELLKKLRPCPERKAIERLGNSGGDFRAAFCALPYMLQQLSVYAYQSHLWNAIARGVVEKHCAPRGPVLAAEDVFGEMLFPTNEAMAPELIDLDLPLLARKTELREPWREAAEAVLKEEGIEVAQLEIPGVRRPFFGEEPRKLFFVAEDFQPGRPEHDESADDTRRKKRTVSFALPRGCYATVLLRALGQ
jgi:tRNA pseudouridine13 synthase